MITAPWRQTDVHADGQRDGQTERRTDGGRHLHLIDVNSSTYIMRVGWDYSVDGCSIWQPHTTLLTNICGNSIRRSCRIQPAAAARCWKRRCSSPWYDNEVWCGCKYGNVVYDSRVPSSSLRARTNSLNSCGGKARIIRGAGEAAETGLPKMSQVRGLPLICYLKLVCILM